jgi:phosphoglycerate dehydrogenase-like enzyme
MDQASGNKFTVALTADFFDAQRQPKFRDMGLSVLDGQTHIERRVFEQHRPIVGSQQIGDAQGVIVLAPRITAESVSAANRLLLIGRFGVGFDSVDVPACTKAGVLVTIASGAVDHSVAEATVGLLLAITHHVRIKDRIVREGGWDERTHWMGSELRERTLGVIGLGGIARKTIELLGTFGMRPPLASDPAVDPATAAKLGVRLVSIDELLREADFVSIHCPLNDQTRGLIGARELSLMKPEAYLVNTARGGIVDEQALYDVLQRRQIAGAAVDCFVDEPLAAPHPLGQLDNVLLAPHSIAWTNEMFRDIGRMACQGMLDLSRGIRPRGVLNPEVFNQPEFQAKWKRECARLAGEGVSK